MISLTPIPGAAMRPETKIVAETPTNPLLTVVDLGDRRDRARRRRPSRRRQHVGHPYLQQPLSHGADVVVH